MTGISAFGETACPHERQTSRVRMHGPSPEDDGCNDTGRTAQNEIARMMNKHVTRIGRLW